MSFSQVWLFLHLAMAYFNVRIPWVERQCFWHARLRYTSSSFSVLFCLNWQHLIYVFHQIWKNFRYLFSYSLGIPTAHKTSCALFGSYWLFFSYHLSVVRLDNLFLYLCCVTHYSLTIILLISQPNGSFILYIGTAHPAVRWFPDKPLWIKMLLSRTCM